MSSDGASHLDCDGFRRIFNACTSSSIIKGDHATAHENRERTRLERSKRGGPTTRNTAPLTADPAQLAHHTARHSAASHTITAG
jgi:hypothetical protein